MHVAIKLHTLYFVVFMQRANKKQSLVFNDSGSLQAKNHTRIRLKNLNTLESKADAEV